MAGKGSGRRPVDPKHGSWDNFDQIDWSKKDEPVPRLTAEDLLVKLQEYIAEADKQQLFPPTCDCHLHSNQVCDICQKLSPEAQAMVDQGKADIIAGRVVDLGSFAQYADIDIGD